MRNRTKRIIKNTISSIFTVLIIFTSIFSLIGIVFNLVYIPAPISSYSMWPTLNEYAPNANTPSDCAYLNKYATFTNNDIVIAEVSWYDEAIIKRLIGCPGDIIEIREESNLYKLYVNEEFVYSKQITYNSVHGFGSGTKGYYEQYLKLINEQLPAKNVGTTKAGKKCIKLNDNEYFLMGDNWGESYDCISTGPIKKEEIIGRVDFVIHVNENKFVSMFKQMCKTLFY